MWNYPTLYDVIVIGAGHAGCEAAHSAARMGAKTLLLSLHLDSIARMSCNPSIGGTAKGHIVREIDALGGIMGSLADRTGIHFRMLNSSKGPAVRSPRAQVDKLAYHREMKHLLEKTPLLEVKQGKVTSITVASDQSIRVQVFEGISYQGKTVVISSGTFLRGLIHLGQVSFPGGRNGEKACEELSSSLIQLGFSLGRLKTGTPPRIHRRSIDFSQLEKQEGEPSVHFSFDNPSHPLEQQPCYITYTSEKTKTILQRDLQKSALFSGKIQGKGPRYCPSIEDKIVRFAHKERHQLFLEPEGISTEEFYVNGFSSSMPPETQEEALRSIPGLEQAEILRPAYAIEYDYLTCGQISSSLESKNIPGIFFAGQINGTTGYEEAAAQGLIAGINAASRALGREGFIPSRAESYIGVLLDDLVTMEIDEPYRMFTSRAEHRLLLRQDNADLRLRHYGYRLGLIPTKLYEQLEKKRQAIHGEIERLSQAYVPMNDKSCSFSQILCRPHTSYQELLSLFPNHLIDHGEEINEQIELELKYAGYIERQKKEIAQWAHLDKISIPKNFDFSSIKSLRNEAKERFSRFVPDNLGSASRLAGISPADISVLFIALQKR